MADRQEKRTSQFAARHPYVTRFVLYPIAKAVKAWDDYRRPNCPLCNQTMGHVEFKPGWRCVNALCKGHAKNKPTIEIEMRQRRNSYNDQR